MLKFRRTFWLAALVATGFLLSNCDTNPNVGPTISDADVVSGLKEALKVGTDSTVKQVNATDGYYGNTLIKILMPPEAQSVMSELVKLPGGQQLVDQVVLKMNRAAETAAKDAAPIFIDAVTKMTVTDGWNILKGADTAATHYLNVHTHDSLYTSYKPKVTDAMTSIGVQQVWTQLANGYNLTTILSGKPKLPMDISDYVTNRALSGLFVVVGQKETKIRNDITWRVTDLLKKVFAQQD